MSQHLPISTSLYYTTANSVTAKHGVAWGKETGEGVVVANASNKSHSVVLLVLEVGLLA